MDELELTQDDQDYLDILYLLNPVQILNQDAAGTLEDSPYVIKDDE